MFMDADSFQSYLPEIFLSSLARYGECVKGKESDEDGVLRNESGGKRCAAAAGAFYIRIVELEAGSLQPADIIDDRSLQIFTARRVQVDLNSIHFEDCIARLFFFFKIHVVGVA